MKIAIISPIRRRWSHSRRLGTSSDSEAWRAKPASGSAERSGNRIAHGWRAGLRIQGWIQGTAADPLRPSQLPLPPQVPASPRPKASFHFLRKTEGSSSAPARNVRTIAQGVLPSGMSGDTPAARPLQESLAGRPALRFRAGSPGIISCAAYAFK